LPRFVDQGPGSHRIPSLAKSASPRAYASAAGTHKTYLSKGCFVSLALLIGRGALAVRTRTPRELRSPPPVEAGHLLRMRCVMLLAGVGILLEGALRLGHCPEVFFEAPEAASRVLQEGDARKIDDPRTARMVSPILHIHNDASRFVEHMPLVRRVDLGVLGHPRARLSRNAGGAPSDSPCGGALRKTITCSNLWPEIASPPRN